MRIQFRECRDQFAVAVLVEGKEVFRNSSYGTAANWAKSRYKLTDAQMLIMYNDYRDDRDRGEVD